MVVSRFPLLEEFLLCSLSYRSNTPFLTFSSFDSLISYLFSPTLPMWRLSTNPASVSPLSSRLPVSHNANGLPPFARTIRPLNCLPVASDFPPFPPRPNVYTEALYLSTPAQHLHPRPTLQDPQPSSSHLLLSPEFQFLSFFRNLGIFPSLLHARMICVRNSTKPATFLPPPVPAGLNSGPFVECHRRMVIQRF